MNMKKTIAALAAGAVAVSAMATTVSALSDQNLVYDLTTKETVVNKGTVNVSGTIANVTPGELRVGFDKVPTGYELKQLTVVFKDTAGGAGSKVFTFDTAWNSDNFIGWNFSNNSYTITAPSLAAGNGVTAYDVTITGKFEHSYGMWSGSTSDVSVDLTKAGTVAFIGTPTYTDETTGTFDETVYKIDFNKDGDTTDTSVAAPVDIDWNGKSEKNTYDHVKTMTAAATNVVLPSAFVGATETVYQVPFATHINNNNDIIRWLEQNEHFDGKTYVNVGPVLNDAIEVYETVTFTFNTAKNYVLFKIDGVQDPVNTYEEAILAADGDASKIMPYYYSGTDKGTDYTKFAQHLYTGTDIYYPSFADENTGYLGYDWQANNLFTGGLVINEGYTMSLSDTTAFDWNQTSVSFDWDTVMDGVITNNSYATYLHTLKLATSSRWYWDNMTVTLTAGAVDDATSDAGAEADDEVLEEEPVEEEVVEEEVIEEEVVEEEVVEEEVAVEEEVEVEVENPTTGNASVALAVIPVALAAAAVVAKKRS